MWEIIKRISKGDYDYALVPNHPYATDKGYVLYHRVVMENHLGRLLTDDEIVHHIDHNKKNNDISNLQVMNRKEHNKMHGLEHGEKYVKLKCPNCGIIFSYPRNQSFLIKKNKYNCNCCSPHCRGQLYSFIQNNGVTEEIYKAISENLIEEYIEYNPHNKHKPKKYLGLNE